MPAVLSQQRSATCSGQVGVGHSPIGRVPSMQQHGREQPGPVSGFVHGPVGPGWVYLFKGPYLLKGPVGNELPQSVAFTMPSLSQAPSPFEAVRLHCPEG